MEAPPSDSLCIIADTNFFLSDHISLTKTLPRLADATSGDPLAAGRRPPPSPSPSSFRNPHVLVIPSVVHGELKHLSDDVYFSSRVKKVLEILEPQIKINQEKANSPPTASAAGAAGAAAGGGVPRFVTGAVKQNSKQINSTILQYARNNDSVILACAYYFQQNRSDEEEKKRVRQLVEERKKTKKNNPRSKSSEDTQETHYHREHDEREGLEYLHNFHKTRTILVTDDVLLQIKSRAYNIPCYSCKAFIAEYGSEWMNE